MPTMQFQIPSQNIRVTKNFPSPVKITELYKGWFKTCQKLCAEIPKIPETHGWEVARWHSYPAIVDEKWIRFDLVHRYTGEKATLVIDRKGPSM